MSLIIGVDVAKLRSSYTFIDHNGELICPTFDAENDAPGVTTVLVRIKKEANGDDDKPVMIMESTGYFSNRLRDYFNSNEITVLEINPLVSYSIRNASIRKVKNDHVDSYELANLFRSGRLNKTLQNTMLSKKPIPEALMNLRVLTRAKRNLAKLHATQKIQLIADLEQVLPAYKDLYKDVCCASSLATLEFVMDDEAINYDRFYNVMKHVSVRFSNSFIIEKFKHLKQIIEDAAITARHVPTYFITIKIHISLLRESNQQIHVLDDNIHALSYDLQEVRLLKTIPGIADDLAAVIASEIGDINRFKNAKALVAYCGLDPAVKQSGEYNRLHNKISKRGAPELRRALYLIAYVTVAKMRDGTYRNQVLRDYYVKLKQSKPGKVALGAIMHKLVRIIYSVLKNQKDFVMITPEQQRTLYKNNMKLIA